MNAVMEIQHVSKKFGRRIAVDDASFTVDKGSFTALLGPNGSGKSTTLKMCTSILAPTSGTITLHGHDISTDTKAALSDTGCAIETPEPYLDRTPWQVLTYLCGLDGMNRESSYAETTRVLDVVGMSESADRRIGTFSKGMRQRIVLAQALLGSPSLLLLDEPTSGLDPRSTAEITSILADLNKNGTTILMSSHMLDEVSSLCDDVVIMDHGRTAVKTTLSEIRSKSLLTLRVTNPLDQDTLDTISSIEGVLDAKISDGSVSLKFDGDPQSRARLIRSLVSSDIDVYGLEEDDPLKNKFLEITGGDA